MSNITTLHRLIFDTLTNADATRKEDIIKSLFATIIYKYCEQLDKMDLKISEYANKSKEYYFIQFTNLLLSDFKKDKKVEHYSSKLGITPKYLSAIVKSVSGKSAVEWIDEYNIAEAITLLKYTDSTIHQISDALHFPSQAYFSKYFKRHTQKIPTAYRQTTDKP